ncbi:MAG: hypothetical protein KatS3mg105_3629 [Gemmatales bacterium]|nr:MAG: hypothetical protein KatS3mg105_3629 [Gemmatales bacterium]
MGFWFPPDDPMTNHANQSNWMKTPSVWRVLIATIVVVAAIFLACREYAHYCQIARQRWCDANHDRNAHYLLGLSLAQAIRHVDIKQVLSDLDGARTWPPLHGILVAATLLTGGIDDRLAVLPSSIAWVGTMVFSFLLAGRLVHQGSAVAGLLAFLFVAVSPAHRIYANDTMLESLGACLSIVAMYLYVTAVQIERRWLWSLLGLTLSILFIHKYNYWFLVFATLVVVEILMVRREHWLGLVASVRRWDWRSWCRNQLRWPSSCLLGVLLALIMYVYAGGELVLSLGGREISIRSEHNLLHLSWVVVCYRFCRWFLANRQRLPFIEPRYRQLFYWHGIPVAVWFLLPKRLGYWIWYMNPLTNTGIVPGMEKERTLWANAVSYWQYAIHDYHVGVVAAVVALASLLLYFMPGVRASLRPGFAAVMVCVCLSLFLTVTHTNHKSRFLHTWLPMLWVASSAMLSAAAFGRNSRMASRFCSGLALLAAFGFMAPHLLQSTLAQEPKHQFSMRDLSDYYLPLVEESKRVAILATVEMKHFIRWSALERFGRRDRLEEIRRYGMTEEENRRAFSSWLATTRCDTIVFIDVLPGSYFDEPAIENESLARLRDFLLEQKVFKRTAAKNFPKYGCTVSIWRRAE